jgi:hypothetical protein
MQRVRFVRTWVSFAILGLAVPAIGCSGGPGATPPEPATEKKIAADMKAAHKEAQAERAQSRKDAMRDRMKGGGPDESAP